MTRGGSFDTKNGIFTTRSGLQATSARVGEVIESFEPGYPSGDGEWANPTWSGDARHISDTDYDISRTDEASLWVKGYFEDWALPDDFTTPPALGQGIRCWLYPLEWNTRPDTGTQYWFTLGDPNADSRNNRLEFNLIHNGTARIRYRNGNARTLDNLDGDNAHINNAHSATSNIWYALDIYSPGSKAIETPHFDEGETLPPNKWQAALHEDGIQDNPITFDFEFSNYQDWSGDQLKVGVWNGFAQDEAIFDDIEYIPEPIPDTTDPDTLTIDDFESYDSGGLVTSWTIDGSGSVDVDSSASLHEDSTQGVLQQDTSQLRSFPGQGLDNYPEDGVECSLLFQLTSDSNQPRVFVAMEDDTWSSETSTWRIQIHGGGLRLYWQPEGSGGELKDEGFDHSWNTGDTYELRFTFDSSSGPSAYAITPGGTETNHVSSSETHNIEDEMSLGLRTAGGCLWDWAQQVDDGEE